MPIIQTIRTMRCSVCHQEGHRSDNRKFHPKPDAPSILIDDATHTSVSKPPQKNKDEPRNEIVTEILTPAAWKFIEQAKIIHGDGIYDYSYVKYLNCDTKVNIWCKKPGHGMFEKVPYNHLKKKSGCPKCLLDKKRQDESHDRREDFIQRAKNVHNDMYDYSSVDFSTLLAKGKVLIGCKKPGHPAFLQSPASHLRGAGCPLCAARKIAESKTNSHDEFLLKAKKIHGDTYDYSDTVYKGSAERITIKCKREGHPPFVCKATCHVQGQGCPICTKEESDAKQRLSFDEFLMRSKAKHGDNTYDYSKSEYSGFHNPITIFCKKHQEYFTQTAGSHMSGQGCAKCGIERRTRLQTFTKDEFIKRAQEVHGEIYDYSEVDYINSQTKVLIHCKKHGSFSQVPNSHLQGYGCNKCAIERNADRCRLEQSEFLKRAFEKHGDTYDYSDTHYVSQIEKLKINCRKCLKSFWQLPTNHVRLGFGCPYCAGNAILTTDQFIEKARKIHGDDTFDYSQTTYVRNNQKVKIMCNKSELLFEQTPNSHLAGSGCPCCKPKYSKPQMEYLAFRSVTSPTLQHALNGGEHRIKDSRYSADGFIPECNHVIEFHGCLWHGCPQCFTHSATNPCTKRTFGEEFERTRIRQAYIESIGYSYTEVWECEWRRAIQAVIQLQLRWRQKNYFAKTRNKI